MKRKKINFSKRQILFFSICLCLLLGIFLGAIGANHMNGMEYKQMGSYIGNFLEQIKQEGMATQNFSSVLIKYGKYAVFIWLCGFLAPGAVFIYVILLFKGLSYGFTTAFLVKQYGKSGIGFAAISYLPQNFILIPAYLAMAYISLEYIFRKFTRLPQKARLKREKQKTNLEYFILFLGELVLICAASAVEVYLVPMLLQM